MYPRSLRGLSRRVSLLEDDDVCSVSSGCLMHVPLKDTKGFAALSTEGSICVQGVPTVISISVESQGSIDASAGCGVLSVPLASVDVVTGVDSFADVVTDVTRVSTSGARIDFGSGLSRSEVSVTAKLIRRSLRALALSEMDAGAVTVAGVCCRGVLLDS